MLRELQSRVWSSLVLNSLADVVQLLASGERIRPSLDNIATDDELIDLMEKCWQDDPIDRPDFGQIKLIIRRLNK